MSRVACPPMAELPGEFIGEMPKGSDHRAEAGRLLQAIGHRLGRDYLDDPEVGEWTWGWDARARVVTLIATRDGGEPVMVRFQGDDLMVIAEGRCLPGPLRYLPFIGTGPADIQLVHADGSSDPLPSGNS